jgi:F-type H+-transporting ATPase subunit b
MPQAETWVAFAFICFLCLLIYLGVHRKLIETLDQRQSRIKNELDEARRLKEEAQSLLAEFQRKGVEAEREAEAIIATAKAEAERLAVEAKAKMEDFIARRD